MCKIIKCDFRRNMRNKEMADIEEKMQKLLTYYSVTEEWDLNDNCPYTEDEIAEMIDRYNKLIEEDKEWGTCKKWK